MTAARPRGARGRAALVLGAVATTDWLTPNGTGEDPHHAMVKDDDAQKLRGPPAATPGRAPVAQPAPPAPRIIKG